VRTSKTANSAERRDEGSWGEKMYAGETTDGGRV